MKPISRIKPNPGSRDPMSWQHELQLALEDPVLSVFQTGQTPGPEARAAAYRVALCLGYCRLLRVDLPEQLDGMLPASEAMAAAEELIQNIQVWKAEARQLPARWDEADAGVEDQYCADLLAARTDAWAAYVAISEAHQDCVTQREPAAADFDRVLDRLLAALDEFDDVLREPEILALLSTLAGTPVLTSWRQMLDIPNSDYLPWWLDGTLEQESRRIAAESLAAVQQLQAYRPPARSAPQVIPSTVLRHSGAAIWEVQIVEALAADPVDPRPPILAILKWRSPDGVWIARLSCPRRVPVGGSLPLEFLSPDGQPAVNLSGQPVWLGGHQQTIDSQGVARFDLQSLRTAISKPSRPITLEVGAERAEWQAIQSG